MVSQHTIPYDRAAAVDYAKTWAMTRNPKYGDFSDIGGDCANFISQCLIAGGAVMNVTRDTGWFYYSMKSRAPAWSSVVYFHKFITTNQGRGPFGYEVALEDVLPGDVIQLKFAGKPDYSHSLLVLSAGDPPAPSNILIATHSYDALDRPLSTYSYIAARVLRIQGSRT